jgi:hypothetical protein
MVQPSLLDYSLRSGNNAILISSPEVRAIILQLRVELTQLGESDRHRLTVTALLRDIMFGTVIGSTGDAGVPATTIAALIIAVFFWSSMVVVGLMLIEVDFLVVVLVGLAALGLGKSSDSIVVATALPKRLD